MYYCRFEEMKEKCDVQICTKPFLDPNAEMGDYLLVEIRGISPDRKGAILSMKEYTFSHTQEGALKLLELLGDLDKAGLKYPKEAITKLKKDFDIKE